MQSGSGGSRKKRKVQLKRPPSKLHLLWLWQQAWDEGSGCFYYYRQSTQAEPKLEHSSDSPCLDA